MLENTKRKVTGNIPDDLLKLVIQHNPENKKEAILEIQEAFEKAASALSAVNKAEKQAIYRLPHKNGETQRKVEQLLYNGDVTTLWKKDSLYAQTELESIIQAEENLLNSLKKYLPQAQNVVITPLGSGQFSMGYKCEVFSTEGKKLISDKAIKVYREQPLVSILSEKNQRFTQYAPDEVILDIEKKSTDRLKKVFGITSGFNRSAEEIRKDVNETLENWNNIFEKLKTQHGAMAEANISEYLRYFTGHKIKPKEGLTIPYMFGLGDTKFCVSEFVDTSLNASKKFNFMRLGLHHTDYSGKTSKNSINGICFDMGGVVSLLEGLKFTGNKSIIHFLKKLFTAPPETRLSMIIEFQAQKGEKIFSDKFIKNLEKTKE